MHLKLEPDSMHQTMSETEPHNGAEIGGEAAAMPDRVKDDMANRRVSTHIPAPLRKKKTEDQYKKFITPTGNPVVYLQQHMRSKSMSDLADEKRDEESHRAEINTRYEEMEKLKVMLKEEEDTWTSHLQSWKSRRKSVTEDARKRKEERDSLEKEAELKTGRRRTKTYREIVEDKKRRDQELANLQDPNDVTSPVTSPTMSNDHFEMPVPIVVETSSRLGKASTLPHRYSTRLYNDTTHHKESGGSNASVSSSGSPVQYKYTTKLTTTISHVPSGSSSSELSRSEVKHQVTKQVPASYEQPVSEIKSTATSTLTYTPPSVSRTLPRSNNQSIEARKKALEDATKTKAPSWSQKNPSTSPAVKRETRSANVPNVLLRTKNPNARKERPKSAHESRSGANPNWSSSLPRNYHEYSAPKPFSQSGSNFAQYRKTAFANRRSMWENISKDNEDVPDASEEPAKPRQKMNLTRDALVSGNNHAETVTPSYLRQQANNKNQAPAGRGGNKPPPKVPLVTPVASSQPAKDSNKSKTHYPAKVPLVAANSNPMSAMPPHSEKMPVSTATLSAAGLSMTSPPASKAATLPRMGGGVENNILFDDMKICINQRPRSEKGFGFTVRGGDDGKPVIVDTVSPGGAADICQLCVGDEILAINDVMLADCKTQDDIVQLIVSSVITGSLSLNIRRYGKVKKSSPLRLSGTKVVMTPGGFVQVRSDKGGTTQTRTPHISKFQKELSTPAPSVTDANNNTEFLNDMTPDLPPPPTQEELDGAFVPPKSGRSESPLSGLISAASKYDDDDDDNDRSDESSSDSFAGDALSEVHTNRVDDEGEEELRREVLEAQKALDFEEVYEHYDQERRKEEYRLRLRLQEEQQKLEEEEAQREAVRRRILEESRLEDLRVEEELRRIQARKQQQQQQRRMEFEKTQAANAGKKTAVNVHKVPEATPGRGIGEKHWMIEEAERLRVAEKEGKPRASALQYGRPEQQGGRGLPAHVIQRLTERTSVHRGNNAYGHDIAATSWNHPNAKATLL